MQIRKETVQNLVGLKLDRLYRYTTVAVITLTVIQTLLVLAVCPELAAAESSGERTQSPSLGGPQSVENQIESDRAKRQLYEIPFLKPYYDWKDELAEKYGFSFGVDYTAVGLKASDSLPDTDDDASGGIYRFFGAWELFGRGTETASTLTWRFGYHDSYSHINPSQFALESLGYVGVTDPLHDDLGSKLNNLYWRQSWMNGGIILIAGFHDIADFAETYALTDPLKHFSNLAFLTGAGTMSIPSSGSLGVVAAAWLNDNIYLQAGLTDSNGDPTEPLDGFDSFFNDNEYFTHAEIGWTTSPDKVYLDNIHLTIWHVDEREELGNKDGWGAVFSFSRWLQDRYLPFLKAGYSDGGGSLLEKSVSIGIGYQPRPIGADKGNLLSLGINWSEPNSDQFGSDVDDQYGIEAFYRWQLSREFAVTPDVQFLINPALNPDEDNIWVFGLRARLAF